MATIRASCPDCGDVELTTLDVTVRVCADDSNGAYTFRCPACRMTVHKPAEPRIVDLLISSGVRLETWTMPLELGERPVGAPFDHDDLLAFHEILEDENWFATLSAMVER
jgi:rRNA maturation protein Nop10